MDCAELSKLIATWELTQVEFKARAFLGEDRGPRGDDLAAALVSLANRLGGRLLIGVDNETHRVESGSFEKRDAVAQMFANVNRDLCSPPVTFTHEYLPCKEGEVLVLEVQRRGSIPHAVVTRKGGEIAHRTYYIRNNQGKQLIGDVELQQMFLNADYPELSLRFPTVFTYRRDPPGGLFFADFPSQVLADMPFTMAFQAVTRAQLDSFGPNEFENGRRLVAEIFPYAVLSVLSHAVMGGWGRRAVRMGAATILEPTGALGREVGPGDIPAPPMGSLLAKVFPDFGEFAKILVFPHMTLPPDTQIEVAYGDSIEANSTLTLRAAALYEVRASYRGGSWNVGLPYGHPLRLGYASRPDAKGPIATVQGDVKLDLGLDFGRVPASRTGDYYAWAKDVFRVLESHMNWDSFLKALPSPYLLRIERTSQEILDLLKQRDSEDAETTRK